MSSLCRPQASNKQPQCDIKPMLVPHISQKFLHTSPEAVLAVAKLQGMEERRIASEQRATLEER